MKVTTRSQEGQKEALLKPPLFSIETQPSPDCVESFPRPLCFSPARYTDKNN